MGKGEVIHEAGGSESQEWEVKGGELSRDAYVDTGAEWSDHVTAGVAVELLTDKRTALSLVYDP